LAPTPVSILAEIQLSIPPVDSISLPTAVLLKRAELTTNDLIC